MVIVKKPVEVRKEDPADKFFISVGCCPGGDLEGGYLISDEIGSQDFEPMHSPS